MPTVIVPAPSPPPICNLAPRDIEHFVTALAAYQAYFARAFRRPEQDTWAGVYLNGLLSAQSRKTTERIALTPGVNLPDRQHFIGQSAWHNEPVIVRQQHLIAARLGTADGLVLIAASGVGNHGPASLGVAPQYCGAVGKVANCQVGVYLGYASPQGDTLVDARLYVPAPWFADDHAEQRAQCGMPADRTFQTKPDLALTLLRDALHCGRLPFQWVALDARDGDTPAFWDGVAALGKWYFAEVACSTPVWWRQPALIVPPGSGRGRRPTKLRRRYPYQHAQRVDAIVRRIAPQYRQRYLIKEGSTGPIICDGACVRVSVVRDGLPIPPIWLVMRPNVADPREVKFYVSHAPTRTPVALLARVSGARWPVELCFAQGKDELGLDHYETRSWLGWQHHMLMVALAHHFLVPLRVQLHGRAPALTIEQVRLLLVSVLPKAVFAAAAALRMVRYYHQRNYVAYLAHRKTRLQQLALSG